MSKITPNRMTIRQAISTLNGLTPAESTMAEISLAEAIETKSVKGRLVLDHPDSHRLDEAPSAALGLERLMQHSNLYRRILMEGIANPERSTVETESFTTWAANLPQTVTGLELAERIKCEGINQGLPDKDIVKNIDAACQLTDAQIGFLLRDYNKDQHEAARKQGRRLRGKS